MEIYYIDIQEKISNSDFLKCINLIDNEKKEKIHKYHFMDDKKRSLYGDILIRHLAINKLGLNNSDIKYYKNQYGKPYLHLKEPFHFNISHSGRYIICGIDANEIGVDIEKICPISTDVAKRFFSKNEYEQIISNNLIESTKMFYKFWTLKESYIKYKGEGLSIPLDSFSFIANEQTCKLSNDQECLNFFSTNFLSDYYIGATYQSDHFDESITQIKINEILNTF